MMIKFFFFVVLSHMFGEFGVRCTCSVLVGNVDADIYFLYVYIVYISMLCFVFFSFVYLFMCYAVDCVR